MPAGEEYVCSLSKASLKRAIKELNEDPKERMGAVETFREWILQQKHIRCDTDTLFLLRFLRCAKFSQLKARELLQKYLRSLDKNKDWCRDIDTQDPKIVAYFKSKHALMCGHDKDGRSVSTIQIGNIDLEGKNYSKADSIRGSIATYMYMLRNEEAQVNGVMVFLDATDFSVKHQAYLGIEDSKRHAQMWQNGLPGRFKGFHYFNVGSVLEGLLSLLKPVLSKKWQERLKFHKTMESVYKHIPKENLPTEYLPDDYKGPSAGTMDELCEKQLKMLTSDETRALVKRMTSDKYFYIDKTEMDDVPKESFRKLNTD